MNISDVEKLIKLVAESNVAEVEVHFSGKQKVRVSKAAGQVHAIPSVAQFQHVPVTSSAEPTVFASSPVSHPETPPTDTKAAEAKPKRPSNLIAIKSPMIGTFYRAPAPDAPPYVEVGDAVKPGTVVCIVEAMKLMNEIESDISGKVVEILVQNETPVEFDQELFLIEPT
ncbi:acetyl-CoA carboxylase biotin carboxyl carrier protein [candidate division WOR-3 bacterium]|nr:acetyl-CoA carboxylase biotin carboxyl carrier protein [candidate division WOR-3 bacterium]